MTQAIGYFAASGSFAFIAVCFFAVKAGLRHGEEMFHEKCRDTVATLAGFTKNTDSRRYYPVVQFEDEGGVQREQAHSNGKCYPDYPVGAPIRIRYCKRKIMGITAYDVRVTEPGYEAYPSRIAENVFKALGLIFLLLTVLFVFMGIREI